MEMAKVTSKGQITIPVSIRRRLKINEGDKLLFIDRPEGVMMVNPDMLGSSQETEIPESIDSTAVADIAAAETATVESAVAEAEATDTSAPPEKTADKPKPPQPPKAEDKAAPDTPPETRSPAPDSPRRKSAATVGNLNLDSLLDEIRSIGRKI